MLSTIKIDVDQDNQPIIAINYLESDDIRDKLVKRFLETFDGSSLSRFGFGSSSTDSATAYIRPIPIKQYPASLIIPIEIALVQYQRQSRSGEIFGEAATTIFESLANAIRPVK